MLTYYPGDVQPDTLALSYGAVINNDGHGFAIVSRGQLIIGHGMDADVMINKFARIRSKHHSGPALFHSRMATAGSINRFNCHPFRIGGDKRTVMAHNGIMPNSLQPKKGDRRSDTRITAEDLLRGMNLGDATYRDDLASSIGRWNKLVILTVNPAYDSNAYLVNGDQGVWRDGIWYSNYDFEAPYEYGTVAGCDPHAECVSCASVGTIDAETVICAVCMICQDCTEHFDDCDCYLPPADRKPAGGEWWRDAETAWHAP